MDFASVKTFSAFRFNNHGNQIIANKKLRYEIVNVKKKISLLLIKDCKDQSKIEKQGLVLISNISKVVNTKQFL